MGPLHGPNPQQMPPAPPPPMAEEAQARPEPAKPWQGQSKGAGAIFRPCGPHTLIPLLFTLSTYSFNKYCLIKTLEGSSWASPGWENQGRRCWVVPGVAVSKEVKGCGRQCVISEMGVGGGSPSKVCVGGGKLEPPAHSRSCCPSPGQGSAICFLGQAPLFPQGLSFPAPASLASPVTQNLKKACAWWPLEGSAPCLPGDSEWDM